MHWKLNIYYNILLFLFFRSLKAKYRSLVLRKIIRALEKKAEVPKTSILEAMVMLKTTWDDVSSTTIVNCFRKSGILEDTRKGALEDEDDPFKDMESESDSDEECEERKAVNDLNQDLDQLRKIRSDMAPEFVDAESLIDFDIHVITNQSRPLSVAEIVTNSKIKRLSRKQPTESKC